jgi:hypothetical protein
MAAFPMVLTAVGTKDPFYASTFSPSFEKPGYIQTAANAAKRRALQMANLTRLRRYCTINFLARLLLPHRGIR